MNWNLCGNQSQGTKARIVIHELLEAQNEQVGIKNSGKGPLLRAGPHSFVNFIFRSKIL